MPNNFLVDFFYPMKMPKRTKRITIDVPISDDDDEAVVVPAKSEKPKEPKPKRKCSEKQLAALAAGRAKNPRLMAKKAHEEVEPAVDIKD